MREAVRHLRRDIDGEVAARSVVAGDDRDRVALHRHHRDPLVLDAGAHDDVGAVQHVALVAGLDRRRQVGSELLELERRAGRERRLGIDDGGQRVVFHDDRLGRVDRFGAGLRDDRRDRVADEPHLVLGEWRPLALLVERHQPFVRRQTEVGGGVHGDDTGHVARAGRVHRHDARVGVGRAHEHEVERAVERQVVDETRLPEQQVGVFDSPDGRSKDRSGHEPTLSGLDRADDGVIIRTCRS